MIHKRAADTACRPPNGIRRLNLPVTSLPLGFGRRPALHQCHLLLRQAIQPVDDAVDQLVGGRQARLERQQALQAGRVLPGQPRLEGARRGVRLQPAADA